MENRVTTVAAAGWDVACSVHGPPEGPLAILLHGFPDSPATFRHLVPVLADAGWRVIVPAMSGSAPTRPRAADAGVHPRDLARMVEALHDAFDGDGRAVLVGHDWGAIATNQVTATRPQLFARAVTLAVAPLHGDLRWPPDLRQLRRSWYAVLLQLPGAWRLLRRRDWAMVERLWRTWSPGLEPAEADRRGWRDGMGPDAGRIAARYYRALLTGLATGRWPRDGEQSPRVATLYLGGNDDGCVRPEFQMAAAGHLGQGSRVVMFDGLGHFLHLEDPATINAHILEWLAASG